MSAKKPKRNQNKKEGLSIGGSVKVNNGDFVGRDKNIDVGNGGVYVGGNVNKSNIVTGNNNNILQTSAVRDELFEEIFKKIQERTSASADDKEDLKANVEEIKAEAEKGDEANETFLARRLRNIGRMAPDILEVVTATLANPAAGFAMVVKKIAERANTPASSGEAHA